MERDNRWIRLVRTAATRSCDLNTSLTGLACLKLNMRLESVFSASDGSSKCPVRGFAALNSAGVMTIKRKKGLNLKIEK